MAESNILTLNDLGLLLEELLVVRTRWFQIGLHLGVSVWKLESIDAQYSDARDQLQEMLKTWLTTSVYHSLKSLTDALRSPTVGASQLAGVLEAKYCSMKDTLESENPAVPLSLKQILRNTKEVRSWYSLGVLLGIQTSFLKRIERDCRGDPERFKIEVIDTWLCHDPEATWNKLAHAVEDMGGHAKVVETLRANHEGVPQISKVPVTIQDEEKSGPPSVSNYPSPPPILQHVVAQGETSSPQLLPHLGAAPQLIQGQFGYQRVKLIKTEPLGTGSYGAVYKALCDDLLCAGKILHPTLFQSSDPGTMIIMSRFQQECSFLSALRHPNIVQNLGLYQDRGTQLPVLLMELMDDSLTQFLERCQEPLPYHTQVNISHDIALALAYLHSNDIIHRDLSSNNVLLIGAGNRAKVTDFGMAKFFDASRSTMTPQTMCPGTLAYMSPEALDDPPVYTKKLDTFSFGVLSIQIITRQFPDPGPRTKKVSDPLSPTGSKYVPVLETERRKLHVGLIDPTHPLLPMVTDCLNYNEEDRPSAQKLCHRLAALKQTSQYGDSVQQAHDRSSAATADSENRKRQLREVQQQQKQIQDLHQQLQVRDGQLHEKDAVIQQKVQQLELVTQEKDRHIDAKEKQLREQLNTSEQVTRQFQQNLRQKEKMIQELQEEKLHLRQDLDKVLQQRIVTQKGSIHGVEVTEEVEFMVSTEGGSFHWKGYGLRLQVSKDSLPPGTAECTINIRVSLAGQFQLPEGSDLLSPVFWISAPCKFTRPVTLEIQHCALTEDEAALSNLSFIFTKCSQKGLPYRFELVDGGVFTTNSTYGSIQLNHFSGVGVTGSEETPRFYCAHLYHTIRKMHWRFYFVIIQDLDAENTVVKEHYGHFAQEATLRVRFEHNEITLSIPPDGLVTTEGWRITPLTAPTITRDDVDHFRKGRWIPECQLIVQWERKDQKPVELRHKVDLTGAKPPYNFIHLILDPAEQAPQQHPGKLHSTPELGDLMNHVAAKIPEKWREVGIGLGLDSADIRHIEADIPTHKSTPCYVMVFDTWKNKGTKEYTWDTLLTALRTPLVNASQLASTIEGQL